MCNTNSLNMRLVLPKESLLNPVLVMRDLDVDSGDVVLAAADAPRDDAGQLPDAGDLADEGAAAVALARVFALFTAGADESVVQLESGSEFGALQHALAQGMAQDGDFDLLERVLVVALEKSVFTPTGDEASTAGEVVAAVGQADGADVRVCSVINVACDADQGDVVVEISRVELFVDEDASGVVLDVRVELGVVVDVPFADANSELFGLIVLDAVSGREDVRAVDEGTAAQVHVVEFLLLQDGDLPRIFRCRIKKIKISYGTFDAPCKYQSPSCRNRAESSL